MKTFCTFLLVILCVNYGISQSKEYLFYSNSNPIQIGSVVSNSNGELYATATLMDNFTGMQELMLFKIGTDQSIKWSKGINNQNLSLTNLSIKYSNQKLYVGYMEVDYITYLSYYVVNCLDEEANLLWSRKMIVENADIYETQDNEFLTVSGNEINVILKRYSKTNIFKLNENGDKIFAKTVNNDTISGKNPGFSFKCTEDGGYVLTAKEGSTCVVSRFDAGMNKIWSKKYGFDYYNHPKTIMELPNGNFLIGGSSMDLNQNSCLYTMVLNSQGEVLNRHYYKANGTGDYYFYIRGFIPLPNSEILFWNEFGYFGKVSTTGEILNASKFLDNSTMGTLNFKMLENSKFIIYDGSNVVFAESQNDLYCKGQVGFTNFEISTSLNMENLTSDASCFVNEFGEVENATLTFENVLVESMEVCRSAGLSKLDAAHNLNIFPNPFNDVVTIQNSDVLTTCEVYDVQGKWINSYKLIDNKIDLKMLDQGVYYVEFKVMETLERVKIIKN